MMLTYKFRLYPSGKQKNNIINNFKVCKKLYNEMLALGMDSYSFGNISLNRPEYYLYARNYSNKIYSQVLQNVADRISKAFKNFYRRAKDKRCKNKGFPRFKNKACSITYPQSGFKFMSDKKLHLSRIGGIPIKLSRIPKGKIKTLTIKMNLLGLKSEVS